MSKVIQKVRVIYSGRVQGVGFRMTVRDLVRDYSIVGTVCNVSDGTVELVAMGETVALMDFLEALDKRMSRYIEGCIVDWLDASEDAFVDFSIAPDKF